LISLLCFFVCLLTDILCLVMTGKEKKEVTPAGMIWHFDFIVESFFMVNYLSFNHASHSLNNTLFRSTWVTFADGPLKLVSTQETELHFVSCCDQDIAWDEARSMSDSGSYCRECWWRKSSLASCFLFLKISSQPDTPHLGKSRSIL